MKNQLHLRKLDHKTLRVTTWVILVVIILVASVGTGTVFADDFETQTAAAGTITAQYETQAAETSAAQTQTAAAWTNTPTLTPTPSETPVPFARPVVVVKNYSGGGKKVEAGKTFDVNITLINKGTEQASNVIANFASGDFVPRGTGGVQAFALLNAGQTISFTQPLTATEAVTGKTVAYLALTITYTALDGTSYSEAVTLAFSIAGTVYNSGGAEATKTPTVSKRPQLVIGSYSTDVDPLQPGTRFVLSLNINNLGTMNARNVSMVLGGVTGGSGGGDGTPQPGGVSGASGEFTNFAPIGSSNIQFLNDIDSGQTKVGSQQLIVNVSTNPGTFPVKFSFLYSDENGVKYQDDQVITLLVYRLPLVEINFYREPDPLFVGTPGVLPIQIVNLSRNVTILGNMKISSPAGTMMGDSMLIGALDAGGYFPLDAQFTPEQAGQVEILVTVQYTDDFNVPKVIEQRLTVAVEEMIIDPIPENGGGGGMIPPPETFWQKVVRFFKGLFGLDSSPAETAPEFQPGLPGDETMPIIPPKG